MRLVLAAVLTLALAAPAHAAWRPPVAGDVTRAFDLGANPYEAGHHRGADFVAPPGTPVRSACAGRVAFAGSAGGHGVVTVRCGRWRVTHLPLAAIVPREGTPLAAGDPLGVAARTPDHAGLHLGVRRVGDPFGYVDPLRFIATRPPVPVGPHLGPPPRDPRVIAPPAFARARVAGAGAAGSSPRASVPHVVWGGVAAVVVGLAGGWRWRPPRRRGRAGVPREEGRSAG